LEMEQLVSEFTVRNEGCDATVLRLGLRVSEGTSLARYLSLPIVPTFAGFDPRLQLMHEDDAVEPIVRATMGRHPGVFNVARVDQPRRRGTGYPQERSGVTQDLIAPTTPRERRRNSQKA